MKKLFFLFILSSIFISCETESPYPDVIPENVVSEDLFGRACASSFVLNDTAYILFGRNAKSSNLVYTYAAGDSTFTYHHKFPGKARINAIAEVVNGRAYTGLGYDPAKGWNLEGYLKDFWMYDPSTNQWDSVSTFPGNATNNCVSFVFDDEIYVMHGFESHLIASSGFTAACWKYSPLRDEWTQLNDFPGYRRASAVAVTNGERVFTGTGYATWNEMDWWEYFPDTDSWEKRKTMPDKGRCNATSFCVDGRFFVYGGRYFAGNYTGGHLKNELMEYDVDKNVWYNRGTISTPRENAISFVLDNKAYIGLGETFSGAIYSDLWSVKP